MFNQLLRECKQIYNRNGYPVAALRTAPSGFSLEDSKRLQLWGDEKTTPNWLQQPAAPHVAGCRRPMYYPAAGGVSQPLDRIRFILRHNRRRRSNLRTRLG
jgi:hypothetical protein